MCKYTYSHKWSQNHVFPTHRQLSMHNILFRLLSATLLGVSLLLKVPKITHQTRPSFPRHQRHIHVMLNSLMHVHLLAFAAGNKVLNHSCQQIGQRATCKLRQEWILQVLVLPLQTICCADQRMNELVREAANPSLNATRTQQQYNNDVTSNLECFNDTQN